MRMMSISDGVEVASTSGEGSFEAGMGGGIAMYVRLVFAYGGWMEAGLRKIWIVACAMGDADS
jgi:hypothetical protein